MPLAFATPVLLLALPPRPSLFLIPRLDLIRSLLSRDLHGGRESHASLVLSADDPVENDQFLRRLGARSFVNFTRNFCLVIVYLGGVVIIVFILDLVVLVS